MEKYSKLGPRMSKKMKMPFYEKMGNPHLRNFFRRADLFIFIIIIGAIVLALIATLAFL